MAHVVLFLVLSAAPSVELDAKRSELVVKTQAAGIGKGFAHNHVVKAGDVSGTVQWEPLQISVAVKAASLVVDDPEVRRRHGETKPIKESDRQAVTDSMLSEKQLDAKRFPTITFESTKVAVDGDRTIVTGDFTLHGVTKRIEVPAKVDRQRGVGEARLTVKTSDYGIKPYKAALGAIQNRDEVELVLRLVAAKGG